MLSKVRFAFTPRWLALHLVTAALIVAMVLLGRWQLQVSNERHFDLQNFGYALQWWAFSAFVLAMWVRALRDAVRKNAGHVTPGRADAELEALSAPPPVYRRYVMPQLQNTVQEPADEHHAAYNAYLGQLAANDAADEADAAAATRTTTRAATNGEPA